MDKISQLASVLHDEWRKPRLKPDGTYEPRLKDNGYGGQVDIANTIYENLPVKWQAENKAAAEWLMIMLDIEILSAKVHEAWSTRNGWSDLAKISYTDLPEEEKEKDRAQVRAAIKILAQ